MRFVDSWASRISWRWGVTAMVAIGVALVLALVVALVPRAAPTTVATATGADGPVQLLPPASATPSDTASPSPAPPATTVPPSEVVATTTPAVSGPGVSESGISVWVTPQMDGSVEVMEAAMYADPLDVVTLDPVDVQNGGPAFAALVPTVTHLQVTADETPVGVLESMSEVTTVTLPVRARHLLLRYHLDGVTVRSTPSSTGRASIVLAPLSAATDSSLPSQIRIGGAPVLNLTCPRLEGDARSCAPVSGGLGVVPVLAARDDVVIAQLDLPSPS